MSKKDVLKNLRQPMFEFKYKESKGKVDEEWIEEKARELCEQNYVNDEAKDFIRSLVKELEELANLKGE